MTTRDSLGLSLLSTLGPRYPTKLLVSDASFGSIYGQKGEPRTRKGPEPKPDELRGGAWRASQTQRQEVTPQDGLNGKIPNSEQVRVGSHVLGP